jgi:hypothetical protein
VLQRLRGAAASSWGAARGRSLLGGRQMGLLL